MSAEHLESGGSEPPLLGELLLAHGFITPEQLDHALAIQAETRQPLGQLLVELGFVSGPTIAQALATQHGRVFKSEYGFGIGFDAALEAADLGLPPVTVRDGNKLTLVAADPVPAVPQEPADQAAPSRAAELRDAEDRIAALAEQLAGAATRIVEAEVARDVARAEAADQAAAVAALEAELREAQRELAEAKRSHAAALAERDAARSTIAELEAAAADAERATDGLRAERARLVERCDVLAEEAGSARRDLAALISSRVARGADAQEQTHHLFFAVPERGYVVVQRDGPAPAVGESVDVSAHGGPAAAHVVKVERRLLEGAAVSFACLI